MSPLLPPITTLPSLSPAEQTHILDLLFEPSPALHGLTFPLFQTHSFTSYASLISAIHDQLVSLLISSSESSSTSSTTETREKNQAHLDGILAAHPRLGEKKVDSAQSAAEQAQLNSGGEEEGIKLKTLNEEYEEAFPGLRYVVFVNGRSRAVIMHDMRSRINRGDPYLERVEAIKAMCEIANDRAGKLQ